MADASTITTFDDAIKFVKEGPKPTKSIPNERKLKVYGLFKQATAGDNTTDKPGMFSGFEAGYKWQAWEDCKGMSKEDAEKAYVEEIKAQVAEFW